MIYSLISATDKYQVIKILSTIQIWTSAAPMSHFLRLENSRRRLWIRVLPHTAVYITHIFALKHLALVQLLYSFLFVEKSSPWTIEVDIPDSFWWIQFVRFNERSGSKVFPEVSASYFNLSCLQPHSNTLKTTLNAFKPHTSTTETTQNVLETT